MKKKKKRKFKFRFLCALLVFTCITAVLGYNLFTNIVSIHEMNITKRELMTKISSIKDQREELESDILKLQDPDYIAKYVREKYLYSKDGEVILRIED